MMHGHSNGARTNMGRRLFLRCFGAVILKVLHQNMIYLAKKTDLGWWKFSI